MTNAEFAILSLIIEKSRHGYEIEQVIEERGMREWTEIGFSSIYYLLRKLEQDGYVNGRIEQQAGRGPARKVYQATPNGRKAYHQATLDALATPYTSYNPLLLGLANLPTVSLEEALTALNHHQEGLSERLARVQARRDEQRPLPDFVEAMFDYSLTMITAEIEWLEKCRNQLERTHEQN